MSVIKQIKAAFLLGVIGVMVLHQALPHVHHAPNEDTQSVSHAEYHHGHTHHHPHHHDDENEEQGFSLVNLLESHSHAFHTHHDLDYLNRPFKNSLGKDFLNAVIFNINIGPDYLNNYRDFHFAFSSKAYYDSPPLLYSPLRGPPSLG